MAKPAHCTFSPAISSADLTANGAAARIRKALRVRTCMDWSVTHGRGTGYGWIQISSPPRRRQRYGEMTAEDRRLLGQALGLERDSYHDGESIPSSSDYRVEYIDRAEGRKPRQYGKVYWD